ncbi:hypothetical protein ACTXIV_02390 [Psychrobacter celer]|uniref:hypothetical protein n=1 Tax=Psychrobacter celer TaxID=306572 RepID=UPI003FD5771F
MKFTLNGLDIKEDLKLIDPSNGNDILDDFTNKCAAYAGITDTDRSIELNDFEYRLLSEALEQEQKNLNTIHCYSSKNGMGLNDAIRDELDAAFQAKMSLADSMAGGIKEAIAAKSKVIDRLFNSEVVVKNPVNKKFWPLVNTSHTFAINHFEEVKGEDGSVTYKITAECDFTILMPNPKDNIDFHGKADLLMAMNHKNLVVIEESYAWPINFVAEEEKQMLEIIHDGIHHDFAMRGAFKEDAA